MTKKRPSSIKRQIDKIKEELQEIEDMRPGSLTMQYKNPKDKKGVFYQLSYTHKMRSKTEYVRPHFVGEIKQQIKAYKKFKRLIKKWIDLSIEHSKVTMDITKRNAIK
ncbi:MAG: hypothetical protein FJ241_13230 [Nitrospira sp.]|nr:hypothetical protein [Nitrospira sp.]